jgi:DNA-binding NarL/FixJ family response regulator
MNALRILVADDHEIVRRGIVALLEGRAGWEVCGQAHDGRDAVEKTKELKPDIVILDIGMPNLNGLEAARQMLHHNPQTKVLILTITEADELVRAVLNAGARGFVLKSDATRDLISAVEALQSNKTFFTSRVADMVLGGYLGRNRPIADGSVSLPTLTPREREVVQLLAEGKSSKEVATHLDLSVKTAETHRSNIMRKLNLHSVGELVLYAVRNNMVQVAVSPPSPPMSSKGGSD